MSRSRRVPLKSNLDSKPKAKSNCSETFLGFTASRTISTQLTNKHKDYTFLPKESHKFSTMCFFAFVYDLKLIGYFQCDMLHRKEALERHGRPQRRHKKHQNETCIHRKEVLERYGRPETRLKKHQNDGGDNWFGRIEAGRQAKG